MPTRYAGSDKEKRALNALITLMRASNAVNARLAAHRAVEGMTLTQLAVLEALLHCGSMCQRELAGKLLVSGANITQVIRVLERDGWVRRLRRTDDRRYLAVEITGEGRKRISAVFPRHVRDVVRAMEALSGAEQETLRGLCRKLGKAQNTGKKP